jgi:ERCC4-type nuclease
MNIAEPTRSRLIVKRDGSSITGSVPKPVVVIDTREQMPFTFAAHPNWIAGTASRKLDVGDYTVNGMESILALERKTLTDLLTTLTRDRARFFRHCARLAKLKYRALLVEASYEEVKSHYDDFSSMAHPNAISGSLDALEAKFGIPIIYASSHRPLAEEKAASWLSKHFTYWWLERKRMGRVLIEGDL